MDKDVPANDAYQRTTNDDLVTPNIHGPYAERIEPKEEDWLLGNGSIRTLGIM